MLNELVESFSGSCVDFVKLVSGKEEKQKPVQTSFLPPPVRHDHFYQDGFSKDTNRRVKDIQKKLDDLQRK